MCKRIFYSIFIFLVVIAPLSAYSVAKRYFYQIKIYHFSTTEQENRLDSYLSSAYLPALHRAGIESVGVFKPIPDPATTPLEKLIYVLIPFSSKDAIFELNAKLAKDQSYQLAGAEYLAAAPNDPPYGRIETILLNAFEKSPKPMLPLLSGPKKDRVYELRSYESPTEKLAANKIRMFNDGDEIGLFKRLGFNAVFYGEVVAGSTMPNLMYMTTFNDRADRNKHWEAFGKDAQWKTLSALPEYQKNVSKNISLFLYPTDYSDI
jgi:hypothetical protein